MGYFQNYYFSNRISKVDSYFEWGTKVMEYSMLLHYLHKVVKIEQNLGQQDYLLLHKATKVFFGPEN